ncbi:MAG TPA: potassium-transporting ATPase subunit KdpC [Propionibacteriaceae bacterium]|nr:potassium-transporting ATPase subunit KdpC [Propionibacteriaceae bacterium]
MSALLRQLAAAVRVLVVMTVLLGFGYPLLVTGIAQLTMPHRADGSLVSVDGRVIGSSLLGQAYSGQQWFQGRPSASDYSGSASGGTNLSMDDPREVAAVNELRQRLLRDNPDAVGPVPPDALTASASGLDPDISPAYAYWQVPRIARLRGVPEAEITALVAGSVQPRTLGFIGEPRVDVLDLNLRLAALRG